MEQKSQARLIAMTIYSPGTSHKHAVMIVTLICFLTVGFITSPVVFKNGCNDLFLF